MLILRNWMDEDPLTTKMMNTAGQPKLPYQYVRTGPGQQYWLLCSTRSSIDLLMLGVGFFSSGIKSIGWVDSIDDGETLSPSHLMVAFLLLQNYSINHLAPESFMVSTRRDRMHGISGMVSIFGRWVIANVWLASHSIHSFPPTSPPTYIQIVCRRLMSRSS